MCLSVNARCTDTTDNTSTPANELEFSLGIYAVSFQSTAVSSSFNYVFNGRKDVIKKVEQYDLNGNLIKIWDSINSAQKTLNCKGIFSALRKGKNISCSFFWKLVE